jgi:hypothetical protein
MTRSIAESNTITSGDHSSSCPNNSRLQADPFAMIKAGSWSSRTIGCEDKLLLILNYRFSKHKDSNCFEA